MTRKALKALKKSIRHWYENLDMLWLNHEIWNGFSKSDLFQDVFIYADNCPLCHLYLKRLGLGVNSCNGCPVKARKRIDMCEKTPWQTVSDTFNRSTVDAYSTYSRLVQAVERELNFLISLLPEGESIWQDSGKGL